MIRVVIADDQQLLRAGLGAILDGADDIEVVGEAGDGLDAIRVTRSRRPDVVLMDVCMPNLDGIEATRRIVAREPGTDADAPSVLVLTTFDADETIHDALQAGAAGFLLKDAPPEQLVEAVRIVAAGDSLLAPAITRKVIASYLTHRPPPSPAAAALLAALTSREREVLEQLAAGKSNAEISRAFVVSESTVKSHVTSLLTKLGMASRTQAVAFAYRNGLVELP